MAFQRAMDGDRLRERGKALRRACPLPQLAVHEPRDPAVAVRIVAQAGQNRVQELLPLRRERMAVDPFAFLRGSAAVMAHDLAVGPATQGLEAQICGDAHLSNFGLYASPERRQVMDLNDFDETIVGPFEYDLKRLVAATVVVARVNGMPAEAAENAVVDAVLAYRRTVKTLSKMPVMQAWSLSFDHNLARKFRVEHLLGVLDKAADKAARNDSGRVVAKMVDTEQDPWQFIDEPPVLRRLAGEEREALLAGLREYPNSLPPSRMCLQFRYRVQDLAFRVVGVGSVGNRAYLALMRGTSDDPFVLQIKQANRSAYAEDPRCVWPDSARGEDAEGRRVVYGQQVMQTVSDPMLGWCQVAGQSFLVRTFRDLKGSVEVADLKAHQLDDYARLCAALLARAHSRSVEPHLLWGYLGNGEQAAEELVRYAHAYANQTEADYRAFCAAE